ncbi:MAG: FmdE family protein [Sulfolobales archaeon]
MVDQTLIEKARDFHGHLCPFLVLGLRASEIAMRRLGISSAGAVGSIREDLLAIVECNNCFADGVQIATGCTFGNNCLIYLDLGKNALTLVRRGVWRGVRVYVDKERLDAEYFKGEVRELFEKVVVRRAGTDEDVEKLHKVWVEISYAMSNLPEEYFKVEEVGVREVERAPIFESVRCESCGELVMKTRASLVGGKAVCLSCQGKCGAVVGRGIVPHFEIPYVR